MDKEKLRRRFRFRRHLIQLYAALLYNAYLKGYLKGDIFTGISKAVCVPGLNCYSCPAAVGACPLGALQNALSASGKQAPWYVLGILLLYGLIFGRTICGWLCPFGLIQELLYKLPTKKLRKGRLTRRLSGLKYLILLGMVIVLPLLLGLEGDSSPVFCKTLCPAGTLEGAIGLLIHPRNSELFQVLGNTFSLKLVLLVLILLACVFLYRAFCRFLCPLGAIYSLFGKIAVLGMQVDPKKCVDCGLCVQKCKMDVRHVGDRECIQCGECISCCPTKAITLKCGKLTLEDGSRYEKKNEKPFILRAKMQPETQPEMQARPQGQMSSGMRLETASKAQNETQAEASAETQTEGQNQVHRKRHLVQIVAGIFALCLLGGVMLVVNRTAQEEKDDAAFSEIASLDFSAPLFGEKGGIYHLAEQLGKPVVLNFWATWCAPCVKELPCFEEISQKYGERISVVAIHSELVTEDVQAFLSELGLSLPFALDEDGSVIALFGGGTQLPMTVILDRNGEMVYNKVGAVSTELLESLIEPLLE